MASITAEVQKGHIYYRCTKRKGGCSQRYLREEALTDQIREGLKEEADRKVHSITTLCEGIKEVDEKLDRLLDGYISGLFTPDEYLAKKEKLVNERVSIEEKLNILKGGTTTWFEPVKDFVTACNSVGKVVEGANLEAQRDFLKKAGSNFTLKERTLFFSWSRPFSFVAEAYKYLDLISLLYSADFKVLKDFSFPGLSQKQRGIKDYSNKQKGLPPSSVRTNPQFRSIWRRERDSNPR